MKLLKLYIINCLHGLFHVLVTCEKSTYYEAMALYL